MTTANPFAVTNYPSVNVAGGAGAGAAGSKFNPMLLLQYLAAAGQDIASGNPFGTNVNAVTQQNISSQNFNKLLARLMGDANNKATPGKVTTDGKKFSYSTELNNLDGSSGLNPFQ